MNEVIRTMWELSQPVRLTVEAEPTLVGKFYWCEYWRKWNEILACRINPYHRSEWTVRTVGEDAIREHSTLIPVDTIFDAPLVKDGKHLHPPSLCSTTWG